MSTSSQRDNSTSSTTGFDRSPGRGGNTLSARRSFNLAPIHGPYTPSKRSRQQSPGGSQHPPLSPQSHNTDLRYSNSSATQESPWAREKDRGPPASLDRGEKEHQLQSSFHDSNVYHKKDAIQVSKLASKMPAPNLEGVDQASTSGLVDKEVKVKLSTSSRRSPDWEPANEKDVRPFAHLGPIAPILTPSSASAQNRVTFAANRPPSPATGGSMSRSPSLLRSPTIPRDMSFLALNSLPSSPAHPQLSTSSSRERSSSSSHVSSNLASTISSTITSTSLPPQPSHHPSNTSHTVAVTTSNPFLPPHPPVVHSDATFRRPGPGTQLERNRWEMQYLMPVLLASMLLALWSLNAILPHYGFSWWLLPQGRDKEDNDSSVIAIYASWIELGTMALFFFGVFLALRMSFFGILARVPHNSPWWTILSSLGVGRHSSSSALYRGYGSGGTFADNGLVGYHPWSRPLLPLSRLRGKDGGASGAGTAAGGGKGRGSAGDIAAVVTRAASSGTMTERRLTGEGSSLPGTPRSAVATTQRPASPLASTVRVSGTGVHMYSSGDRYEGELYQGKCQGSGVYYFAMNGQYEGDWEDGKYHGYGMETWSQGNRYRGQYRNGYREGYGVYRFYTGDVYAGQWKKGQSFGIAMQTCSDGSRYLGYFQWGHKHGYGKYIFRNGDIYSGEYYNDKMHGYGMYLFANGHRYEGAWHEGRKQGLGLYTFRNGETSGGYWSNGLLATRAVPPGSPAANAATGGGTSPTLVDDNRVGHAVQEARRWAKKSEMLESGDEAEKVSHAVMMANRAAIAARVAAVKAAQSVSS